MAPAFAAALRRLLRHIIAPAPPAKSRTTADAATAPAIKGVWLPFDESCVVSFTPGVEVAVAAGLAAGVATGVAATADDTGVEAAFATVVEDACATDVEEVVARTVLDVLVVVVLVFVVVVDDDGWPTVGGTEGFVATQF